MGEPAERAFECESFIRQLRDQNFTLAATSAARGGAGPLTTVVGSGSGTTFNVAAGGGGFFPRAERQCQPVRR